MEDFGFVQRDAKVLANVKSDGSKEGEEGEEEEEEGGSRRGSLERKSGESSSPEVPSSIVAGARENHRSDSSGSGGSKGKAAGRLARTMSAYTSKEKPTQPADPSLNTLPQSFMVKYLGKMDARGLWGIKHTRRPVDAMVTAAKGSDGHPPQVLPLIKLTVSKEGVTLTAAHITGEKKKKGHPEQAILHPIETISYGVQDLVYTRVFSMIIVRETTQMLGNGQTMQHPFQCHGFVCDSKNSARRLTYVLAAAFQEFSTQLKAQDAAQSKLEGSDGIKRKRTFKKFAIDLRTPEQIEQDLKEPDSEA